jgi:hypothetical protein
LQIAVARHHACARISDGTVRCWGKNAAGQLGDGTTTSRAVSQRVAIITDVVDIAAESCVEYTTRFHGVLRDGGERGIVLAETRDDPARYEFTTGDDPSNGIGDQSYIFPAIAAMYLVAPGLALLVVQLSQQCRDLRFVTISRLRGRMKKGAKNLLDGFSVEPQSGPEKLDFVSFDLRLET